MNMVRSMISEKKIPKPFWPEVVNQRVHVLNRSPTLAVIQNNDNDNDNNNNNNNNNKREFDMLPKPRRKFLCDVVEFIPFKNKKFFFWENYVFM